MFEDSSNEADFSFQGKVTNIFSEERVHDKNIWRNFKGVGSYQFWVSFAFSKMDFSLSVQ